MTTEGTRPTTPSTELRRQEAEFYQAVTALLAGLPRGTTVQDALATVEGQRIRTKWMLKYGRRAPL
jgi:hypothetical protein